MLSFLFCQSYEWFICFIDLHKESALISLISSIVFLFSITLISAFVFLVILAHFALLVLVF